MKLPPKIMTRAELRAIRAANGVVIARRWPLSPRRHHMRIDTTIPWRQSEHGKAKIQASNARPENQTANRDRMRAYGAKRDGYAPPPLERDCPPRPADGRCDCCLVLVPGHKPGAGLSHQEKENSLKTGMRGWRRSADRARLHANSLLTGNFTGKSAIPWLRKTTSKGPLDGALSVCSSICSPQDSARRIEWQVHGQPNGAAGLFARDTARA